MELTAANVNAVFLDCLFKDEEASNQAFVAANAVMVEGIMSTFGLHHGRVESHKADILDLINQLPESFHNNGWTFLNLPTDHRGELWGQQQDAEQLYVLGASLGVAEFLMPRPMWHILPGGVPYINFKV